MFTSLVKILTPLSILRQRALNEIQCQKLIVVDTEFCPTEVRQSVFATRYPAKNFKMDKSFVYAYAPYGIMKNGLLITEHQGENPSFEIISDYVDNVAWKTKKVRKCVRDYFPGADNVLEFLNCVISTFESFAIFDMKKVTERWQKQELVDLKIGHVDRMTFDPQMFEREDVRYFAKVIENYLHGFIKLGSNDPFFHEHFYTFFDGIRDIEYIYTDIACGIAKARGDRHDVILYDITKSTPLLEDGRYPKKVWDEIKWASIKMALLNVKVI